MSENQKAIEQCRHLIEGADAVLVGAGSGLSTAAGIEYGGQRFRDHFADYIERYGIEDMYSAAFYPYPTPEERWGYFSRHIQVNRWMPEAMELYLRLHEMLKDKSHFVLTTNVDSQFVKAGFEADKVFATQGDYGSFQCATPCHDTLYDNQKMVAEMVERQRECKIPSELLPVCPVCGGPLDAHLRKDTTFVENADWHAAKDRYQRFVSEYIDKNLVLLELGVGFNTPVIIRWPFEQISGSRPNCHFIRVNRDHVEPSYNVSSESVLIRADIGEWVKGITD